MTIFSQLTLLSQTEGKKNYRQYFLLLLKTGIYFSQDKSLNLKAVVSVVENNLWILKPDKTTPTLSALCPKIVNKRT